MQRFPSVAPCNSLPSPSTITGFTPGNGRVAEPGFNAVAPGNGLIRIPPVSVCHQVSTTGQRSSPTVRQYHSHASGLIGSPTVPSRRRLARDAFFTGAANAAEPVADRPTTDHRQRRVDVDGAGAGRQEEPGLEVLQIVDGEWVEPLPVDRQNPLRQEAGVEREQTGRVLGRGVDVTPPVADHEGVPIENAHLTSGHRARLLRVMLATAVDALAVRVAVPVARAVRAASLAARPVGGSVV